MARVGYLRFSTEDQKGETQQAALTKAGCERIFRDCAVSGKLTDKERDGLRECLDYLREGDTLVVAKLDRLGRDMLNLISVVNTLIKVRGIRVHTLDCGEISLATATDELLFHIRAALTQWERRMILERTMEGLETARAEHGHLGHLPKLSDTQALAALAAVRLDGRGITEVAEEFGVSRSTLHRTIARISAAGAED